MRRLMFPILLALAAQPALAQQTAGRPAGLPVTQGQEGQALNAALARLGKDPRDVSALIDAGNAALAMGDVDAAVGFFARADQLAPNSPRVRAGLAGALVHSGNPYDAIPLFAEAEAAGGMDPKLNAERGLAYDLVGDNATAQRYYIQALSAGPNDETTRRLALSEAIAGDRAAMEASLSNLIQRQDKAALRIRAFGLAILGRSEEAVLIAEQTMPRDLAAGIAPYLRYMPRLTRAQQAAAANFGHFPRAAEIGHDDPRALKFAPPVRVASADIGLVPGGEPLGGKGKDKKPVESGSKPKPGKTDKDRTQVAIASQTLPPRVAPGELQPRREESETPSSLPTVQAASKPAPVVKAPVTPPPAPAPKPAVAVASPPPTPAPEPTRIAASNYDLAKASQQTSVQKPSTLPPVVAKPAAPPPAPVAQPARPRNFSEAFGDLGAPEAKPIPVAGAVDVRKIVPARAKPEVPPNPSRIWVQVGVGRNKSSLAFTWRGLVKDYPELFKSKSAAVSEWGRTNRLLTGPFETASGASAFLAKLKREEIDAFVWTSPAGQVVDPLSTK